MKTKHTRLGRTLTVAAAVAGVVTAFAEESPHVAPAPPLAAVPGATGPVTTTTATAPSTPTLGQADRDFLQKAMELHATGSELAKLADKNAGTEEIQSLGDELLTEHTRSIAALREIARMKDVDLNANPTALQQATIAEFTAKLGRTFDEDYRAQALSNHELAIRLFSSAAGGAKDSDIRMYAERSLGEMKERHAALGGAAVKIKGSVASSLPKPAKSLPPEVPVKKGAKTKTPVAATPPPVSQVAATTPAPTPAPARPRVPARPPMPESTFVQNLDGTYSMVDVATAAAMGADPRSRMNVPGYQIPASSDPRAMWMVPREVAYGDQRMARQPATNVVLAGGSTYTPPRTERHYDANGASIASAPVARVVTSADTPRQVLTRDNQETVYADRPTVTVRRVPATRTFRIFGGDDD